MNTQEAESMQQLLYFASHDLAEPLRAARIMVDIASKAEDIDKARELCSKAQTALVKAQRLVAALNEYRKLSSLDQNGPVPLYDALMEAKDAVAGFNERGTTLKVSGELPEVRASRFALVAIFRNLLSNAVKYTGRDQQPSITVSARISGTFCTVSVSDKGLGFEQKHAESIFTLGQRIHPDVEGSWGDGIGLANCRAAVASQGGRIWATSPGPGLGATFCFSVPTVSDDPSR